MSNGLLAVEPLLLVCHKHTHKVTMYLVRVLLIECVVFVTLYRLKLLQEISTSHYHHRWLQSFVVCFERFGTNNLMNRPLSNAVSGHNGIENEWERVRNGQPVHITQRWRLLQHSQMRVTFSSVTFFVMWPWEHASHLVFVKRIRTKEKYMCYDGEYYGIHLCSRT